MRRALFPAGTTRRAATRIDGFYRIQKSLHLPLQQVELPPKIHHGAVLLRHMVFQKGDFDFEFLKVLGDSVGHTPHLASTPQNRQRKGAVPQAPPWND